jgi:hypothetical protein
VYTPERDSSRQKTVGMQGEQTVAGAGGDLEVEGLRSGAAGDSSVVFSVFQAAG